MSHSIPRHPGESSYDYGVRLDAHYDAITETRRWMDGFDAKARLRSTLDDLDSVPRLHDTSRFGLARRIDGRAFYDRPCVPFGWRKMRVEHRDVVEVMPLWLYWPVRLWRDRYHLVFSPLMRLGLWTAKEGDRYVDGRATLPLPIKRAVWCFLHDADHAPRPRFSDRPIAGRPFHGLTPRQYEALRPVSHQHFMTKNGFLARIEYR